MKISALFLATIVSLSAVATMAADTSPLAVVQQQLDTYNAHDIDGFAAVFADDAEIFRNIGDAEPRMKGRAAIHAGFGKLFRDNPRNKSTLMGRLVQGDHVIDHEWITGRDDAFKIVAIYEVKGGLITRAWFIR